MVTNEHKIEFKLGNKDTILRGAKTNICFGISISIIEGIEKYDG